MTKWDGGPFLTLCIDTKAEEHHESVARSLVSPKDNNSKLMYGPYAAGTDCYATNLVAGKMSLVLYIRLRVKDTIRIVVAPSTFSNPTTSDGYRALCQKCRRRFCGFMCPCLRVFVA